MLDELLLGEGAYFGVFYGKDTVHNFDNRRVGAERVIKACKLDADRSRADDEELFGHARRCERVFVGPDQITISLKARQLAGARACGEDDVLGSQLLGAVLGFDAYLAFGGHGGFAHDGRDFVLFHQVGNAA